MSEYIKLQQLFQKRAFNLLHTLVKRECCLSCRFVEVDFSRFPRCICRATDAHPSNPFGEIELPTYGDDVSLYEGNYNCQHYQEADIGDYIELLPSDLVASIEDTVCYNTRFSETPEYKELDNAPIH